MLTNLRQTEIGPNSNGGSRLDAAQPLLNHNRSPLCTNRSDNDTDSEIDDTEGDDTGDDDDAELTVLYDDELFSDGFVVDMAYRFSQFV